MPDNDDSMELNSDSANSTRTSDISYMLVNFFLQQ